MTEVVAVRRNQGVPYVPVRTVDVMPADLVYEAILLPPPLPPPPPLHSTQLLVGDFHLHHPQHVLNLHEYFLPLEKVHIQNK